MFVFKHKTAYEMRISDWSSDVCSSDLQHDEQRIAVDLNLGPLMGMVRIFHRQFVQAEFVLQGLPQWFVGLQCADPDQALAVGSQGFTDVIECDVLAFAGTAVGEAVDPHGGVGFAHWPIIAVMMTGDKRYPSARHERERGERGRSTKKQ